MCKKILNPVLAILSFFYLCGCGPHSTKSDLPVYLDDNSPVNERISDALSRMTLKEKVAMCHAQSKFSSAGVPRLGIPEIWTTDGPHGIRPEVLWDEWNQAGWTNDSCTAYPALTCLAATWNSDMSLLYGKSIGEEARYRNKNILLGPGVNIYRTPLNGRNFEYMGEDPFLSSAMVVPYIKGVQSNGVAACVKHFALNNQERYRGFINVNVSDRALHEIYLPAFKAAVKKGKVWALMGAYNQYKNQHCCENEILLRKILRDKWHFDGVAISDWNGTHNTMEAVKNGLDIEYGTEISEKGKSDSYDHYFMAGPYLNLIRGGELDTTELNEKARNILRLELRTNMNRKRPFGSFANPAHSAADLAIAEEGIVLLKNDGNILPINDNKVKSIAVIGENAIKMMTVGGGSSSLKVKYEILPLEGIEKRAGKDIKVTYERGYIGDTEGSYNGVNSRQNLSEKRSAAKLIEDAVAAAGKADYVIYVGGLNKSEGQDCEGADRKGLELPYGQDKLIDALSDVNKNMVVINISGNAVAMPWKNKVPAIIQGWYLGSEAGNALAAVLFGDVNPSGKLPFTFPQKLSDSPAFAMGEYPGKDGQETYNEGIFVGYRYADEKKTDPLFCFGYGLSYTSFKYEDITIDRSEFDGKGSVKISVRIKNTGNRAGKEIAELYIKDPESSLPRPPKELKGFSKIALEPGESKIVTFNLTLHDLEYYDPEAGKWKAEKGVFEALVGSSSRDIKGSARFNLTKTTYEED
ncbi:MAG: glycoside hydrolase family 3 C-terminal domain-containing protein [Bacteroidales bacterium]|nr:glycoside hydrolase family 3 C-terminal domain-containing protein [Bacteroidales bacterium]